MLTAAQVSISVDVVLWVRVRVKARANARNMLGPTLLRLVGQQCCERLHGPLAQAPQSAFLILFLYLFVLSPVNSSNCSVASLASCRFCLRYEDEMDKTDDWSCDKESLSCTTDSEFTFFIPLCMVFFRGGSVPHGWFLNRSSGWFLALVNLVFADFLLLRIFYLAPFWLVHTSLPRWAVCSLLAKLRSAVNKSDS